MDFLSCGEKAEWEGFVISWHVERVYIQLKVTYTKSSSQSGGGGFLFMNGNPLVLWVFRGVYVCERETDWCNGSHLVDSF